MEAARWIRGLAPLAVLALLALGATLPTSASALRHKKKKKEAKTHAPAPGPRKFPFDPDKLVWPSPPNIGRIHWVDYFAGMKIDYSKVAKKKPKDKGARANLQPLSEPPQNVELIRKARKPRQTQEEDEDEG